MRIQYGASLAVAVLVAVVGSWLVVGAAEGATTHSP